jgi:transcriptional regulator GlxA family with amidase domain
VSPQQELIGNRFSLRFRNSRALHYAFRRGLQRTPGLHLSRLQLDRAKALVEGSRRKMGEVAAECGFPTLRNFHHAFARAFGSPPATLRAGKRVARPEVAL